LYSSEQTLASVTISNLLFQFVCGFFAELLECETSLKWVYELCFWRKSVAKLIILNCLGDWNFGYGSRRIDNNLVSIASFVCEQTALRLPVKVLS